jgi:hypothetical protein
MYGFRSSGDLNARINWKLPPPPPSVNTQIWGHVSEESKYVDPPVAAYLRSLPL